MSVRHVWHLPLNVAVALAVVIVVVAPAVDGQAKFAVKKLMQHLDKVRELQNINMEKCTKR